MTNPIRPTDEAARDLAKTLLTSARHTALGVIDPATNGPMVSRIATAWIDNAVYILISDLSLHTQALARNPACSVLIGEPGGKGDPLTHPRITLQCVAKDADKGMLKDAWLSRHPKAKLYFDFTDFRLTQLEVQTAHLNGGFGKAFHLTPQDLVG